MPRIFISYRRSDSEANVGRIYERLVRAFGSENVFKDVNSITLGGDFPQQIGDALSQCDVLLVIIGPGWLNAQDEDGNRRLDDPDDFVRLEVQFGLMRGSCTVVPVLINGASMPAKKDLPDGLRSLGNKNAATIGNDPDFDHHMKRLIAAIKEVPTSGQRSQARPDQPIEAGGKRLRSPQVSSGSIPSRQVQSLGETIKSLIDPDLPGQRRWSRRTILGIGAALVAVVLIAIVMSMQGGGDDSPTPAPDISSTLSLTPATTATPTAVVSPTPFLPPNTTPTRTLTDKELLEDRMTLTALSHQERLGTNQAATAAALTAIGCLPQTPTSVAATPEAMSR